VNGLTDRAGLVIPEGLGADGSLWRPPRAGGRARQLFVLLHGAGATPGSMAPLADAFEAAFPDAVVVSLAGSETSSGGARRQWFDLAGIDDANRPARVAAALPALVARVRAAQARSGVLTSDTALVGFSQGAIVALELAARHDGLVGRVLAFAGRYATLPDAAPALTTLHLFHGAADPVIPVDHARRAFDRLAALDADVTVDVADGVGHTLHPALVERALSRLATCVPLRTWRRALGGA
jgi:phospholipase/carboxylesterase